MKNNKGFSALELMFALLILSSILYMSNNLINSWVKLVPGETAAQQAYKYSQSVVRYITTHQTLLISLLNPNGAPSGLVATVSPQVLVNEGYLNSSISATNNLNQIPCTVIYYQNNQLQAFIYYRDNNNSKQLDPRQLNDGLNHMGAMMGIYQNGSVASAGRDWTLQSGIISQIFVSQGTADISQGANPSIYYCDGSQIANNSYVVNVGSMLNLNNQLANDDTIHQYQDALHDVDEVQNNNMMNNDLNMDYINSNARYRTRSNIIFQNNPNCQIDPNNPATLDDYPNNSSGCKNRQLGIEAGVDNNGNQTMTVTGFQQGGVQSTGQTLPYVGQVAAASIQPTAQVAVGTACLNTERGKMAQQQKSNDPNDVNNIYVSQVVCMQSPTCPVNANGYCYLPVQSVTINFFPNTSSQMCPTGMFITNVQTDVNNAPDYGRQCCGSVLGVCYGYASSHDHIWEGYQAFKDSSLVSNNFVGQYLNGNGGSGGITIPLPLFLANTTYPNIMLPNQISIGQVRYASTCDAACSCPPEVRPRWQPVITSMTCTNDPSQASIIVQQ
jgi:hypothetical protein